MSATDVNDMPDIEPAPTAPISAENLMAITGIRRILDRDPQKITAADKHKAAALPREIRRAVARFLDPETGPRPVPKAEKFDYAKALDSITAVLEPGHMAELAGMFYPRDAVLVMEYLALATRLVSYLQSLLPIRTLKTMAATINVDPSDTEIARFRRAFDIVNDPMIALRDMEYLMLVGDQVKHLSVAYPGLYAEMRDRMAKGMADELAKKKSWELSRRKDFQVQTFFGTSMFSEQLAQQLQGSFGIMEKEKENKVSQASSKIAESVQTPTGKQTEGDAG